MTTLRLDVWSDLACPWCYVGKRRLEAALARFAHRDAVAIAWRSFELDPAAPAIHGERPSYVERLGAKLRRAPREIEAMLAQMTRTGAAEGLEFRYDRIRGGNTFDAHRLLHLARARGGLAGQGALKERLLRAYFTEGRALGDRDALVELAGEAGLRADDVRAALAGDAHAAEVRADQRLARELGISGVPFFVVGGRLAVSGAQPPDALLGALEQAWASGLANGAGLPGANDDGGAEGAACGPDGCA